MFEIYWKNFEYLPKVYFTQEHLLFQKHFLFLIKELEAPVFLRQAPKNIKVSSFMDDFLILLRSSFSSQYKAAKTYDQIHYLLLRRQIARHTILTPKYLVRNLQKLAKLISSRSSWISCSIWGNMSRKLKIGRSEISFKSLCKFLTVNPQLEVDLVLFYIQIFIDLY